jgi:DNA-binding IclR family transcriptional regulator
MIIIITKDTRMTSEAMPRRPRVAASTARAAGGGRVERSAEGGRRSPDERSAEGGRRSPDERSAEGGRRSPDERSAEGGRRSPDERSADESKEVSARSPVPALDRGLDVLECMAGSVEALSLTGIARKMGRSVSEIQRTVARLTVRSYLVRNERGAYRLSAKLFRLAGSYPPFRDLVVRAVGPMQSFVDRTAESVHLGVLSDDQLLLIAQVEGRGFVRVSPQVGALQDATTTISGRILLSGLPPAELEAFCERRSLGRSERQRLEKELAHIREHGHAHAESHAVYGVQDLGVPVALPGGQVLAALTTSWLPARRGPSRVQELLGPLEDAARVVADAYEPAE